MAALGKSPFYSAMQPVKARAASDAERFEIVLAGVYPDEGDLTVHEELRGFTSFEHCQAAADYALKLRSPEGGGTFECGYRCRYDPGMQINVCKETRD